ncbi:MAG: LysM peptidoglycan-binding domain-containing protein [Elusimicrobia bacterium]|nr:LysM peptidoglycan-binding domain-containing protein [Elusimicrobiota bacterium]
MRTATAVLLAVFLLWGASAAAQKAETVKFQEVTVKPGDTLWSISQRVLKDPEQWSEIVRYNKLPSSDPTVALPGMTLRVPVALIKEELRAATLVEKRNEVRFRRKEQADWRDAAVRMPLYRDDGLQTLRNSQAQVRFDNGELLSLDQNSMAILRPKNRGDADLDLQRGQIATARSRVVTRSARIVPQTPETQYTATVSEDMTTRVAVVAGRAEVEGAGRKVMVKEGFQTDVAIDQAPAPPEEIPDLPAFKARFKELAMVEASPRQAAVAVAAPRASAADSSEFAKETRQLAMGVPVSAYHLQVSRSADFGQVLFDKYFEAEERLDLSGARLAPGDYWVRVAVVDLLGAEGQFKAPRRYALAGKGRQAR